MNGGSPLENLHKNLVEKKMKVPDFPTFKTVLTDESERRSFWKNMKTKVDPNFPGYQEFESTIIKDLDPSFGGAKAVIQRGLKNTMEAFSTNILKFGESLPAIFGANPLDIQKALDRRAGITPEEQTEDKDLLSKGAKALQDWYKTWDIDSPTGKFAKPMIDDIRERGFDAADVNNLKRVGVSMAENAGVMGVFIAATLKSPTLAFGLMTAVEGGDFRIEMKENEKRTGEKIPEIYKKLVPIAGGLFNALLEYAGIGFALKSSGVGKQVAKRIVRVLMSAKIEGLTEAAQELTKIGATYFQTEELPEGWEERLLQSYTTGMGLGGGVSTLAIGTPLAPTGENVPINRQDPFGTTRTKTQREVEDVNVENAVQQGKIEDTKVKELEKEGKVIEQAEEGDIIRIPVTGEEVTDTDIPIQFPPMDKISTEEGKITGTQEDIKVKLREMKRKRKANLKSEQKAEKAEIKKKEKVLKKDKSVKKPIPDSETMEKEIVEAKVIESPATEIDIGTIEVGHVFLTKGGAELEITEVRTSKQGDAMVNYINRSDKSTGSTNIESLEKNTTLRSVLKTIEKEKKVEPKKGEVTLPKPKVTKKTAEKEKKAKRKQKYKVIKAGNVVPSLKVNAQLLAAGLTQKQIDDIVPTLSKEKYLELTRGLPDVSISEGVGLIAPREGKISKKGVKKTVDNVKEEIEEVNLLYDGSNLTLLGEKIVRRLNQLFPKLSYKAWKSIFVGEIAGEDVVSSKYSKATSEQAKGLYIDDVKTIRDLVVVARDVADIQTLPHEFWHRVINLLRRHPIIEEGIALHYFKGHEEQIRRNKLRTGEWDYLTKEQINIEAQDYARRLAEERLIEQLEDPTTTRLLEDADKSKFELWYEKLKAWIKDVFGKQESKDVYNQLVDLFASGEAGRLIERERVRKANLGRVMHKLVKDSSLTLKEQDDMIEDTIAATNDEHLGHKTVAELDDGIVIKVPDRTPDVTTFGKFFMTPIYQINNLLRKVRKTDNAEDIAAITRAAKNMEDVSSQELLASQHNEVDYTLFNEIFAGLSKSQLENSRKYLEVIRSDNREAMKMALIKDKQLFQAMNKLRSYLDFKRGQIQDYQRVMIRKYISNNMANALDEVLRTGDVISAARSHKVSRSRLSDLVERYANIKNWGIDDYITNIESGTIKIQVGHMQEMEDGSTQLVKETRAIALTRKEAIKKIRQMVDNAREQGIDPPDTFYIDDSPSFKGMPSLVSKAQFWNIVGRLRDEMSEEIGELGAYFKRAPIKNALGRVIKVKPSFKHAGPMMQRKGKLEGEADLSKVMYAYAYAMNKKMALDPVIHDVQANIYKYPLNVQDLMMNQVEDTKGVHSIGEDIVKFITRGKLSPMAYSKVIGKARNIQANLKLGYRPVAAGVNFLGGLSNVYTKIGGIYVGKAMKFSGTPEAKQLLKEEAHNLGQAYAIEATGVMPSKINLYSPLGLFQIPEPILRRLTYLGNYLYAKEKLGLSETAAREEAKRGVWFQQFTYNIAALPKWMRGPTGKLVGQFKTYLVNQTQFLHSVFTSGNPGQILRLIGTQVMLLGPRGYIYVLRSLPLMFMLGWLDDLEKWLDRKYPRASRGIGGFLGIDVTGPGTMQLPNEPADWVGPTISDIYKLISSSLSPLLRGETHWSDDFLETVRSLPIALQNVENFFHTFQYDESNKFFRSIFSDDGWVRDKNSNKLYHTTDWWDRAMILAGAKLRVQSQQEVFNRIMSREEETRNNSLVKIVDRIEKDLRTSGFIDERDIQDLILLGGSEQNISNAFRRRLLEPRFRQFEKVRKMLRPEVLEEFPIRE